jgi:hypothetical protein
VEQCGVLADRLIDMGRALARYQTLEIIDTIKRRAAANQLNRGLSISLPFFDDQALAMKVHCFQVIPKGRVMFVPAFVVLAVHRERARVMRNTRLNDSTRHYLLSELTLLEEAFAPSTLSETN